MAYTHIMGENYENINDVYIVYISRFDVFNRKRRIYYVERSFHDKGEILSVDDGEHFIYVNASSDVDAETEDAEVAELMEFFKNSQGQNTKFQRLTNRVHDLKNNESEVNTMCKLVEDYAKEYAKEYARDHVKEYAEEYAKEYAREHAEEYAKDYAKEYAGEMICDLVRKGALSAEIGAEQLNLSMEEFYELLKEGEPA